ncbi:MAG: hypothetical protein U1G07_22755 [Verrucomicrobiota bacterium]
MNNRQLLGRTGLLAVLASMPLVSNVMGAAVPVDPKSTITASMDGGAAKTGGVNVE